LVSKRIQEYIISLSERARQAGVSPKDLDKLDICLPSIETQEAILKEIKEEEELINHNKEIIARFERKMQEKLNFIWGK
jgi:restriction endonuclease S subunit